MRSGSEARFKTVGMWHDDGWQASEWWCVIYINTLWLCVCVCVCVWHVTCRRQAHRNRLDTASVSHSVLHAALNLNPWSCRFCFMLMETKLTYRQTVFLLGGWSFSSGAFKIGTLNSTVLLRGIPFLNLVNGKLLSLFLLPFIYFYF